MQSVFHCAQNDVIWETLEEVYVYVWEPQTIIHECTILRICGLICACNCIHVYYYTPSHFTLHKVLKYTVWQLGNLMQQGTDRSCPLYYLIELTWNDPSHVSHTTVHVWQLLDHIIELMDQAYMSHCFVYLLPCYVVLITEAPLLHMKSACSWW